MTKETITYTDLNGIQRTEDFYFDLSKPEIVKMQASAKGGYDVQLKSIAASPIFKTYTICQWNVKFNGALDTLFDEVGCLFNRVVERNAINGIGSNDRCKDVAGT